MTSKGFLRGLRSSLAKAAVLLVGSAGLWLQSSAVAAQPVVSELSYADIAGFIDPAELVLRARILKQSEVPPERAPGLRTGWARLYIEAAPVALLAGKVLAAEKWRYLVDVPRSVKGRAPRLKGSQAILFARLVAGRPGELQLVGAGAQLQADEALEARIRPILAEFFSVDAPPRITGIRDVLWVPGNLVGESETQLFLTTSSEVPALISVIRRPGMAPAWGVSWTELVDQSVRPPAPDTLAWYRLACFLPPRLPPVAQLSSDPVARDQAERDYQLVRRDLGACMRSVR
jgi:hypothetical protein